MADLGHYVFVRRIVHSAVNILHRGHFASSYSCVTLALQLIITVGWL